MPSGRKAVLHKAIAVMEPGGELCFVSDTADNGIDDVHSLRDAVFLYAPSMAVSLWERHKQAVKLEPLPVYEGPKTAYEAKLWQEGWAPVRWLTAEQLEKLYG